jgi:hypothetical protein
VDHEDASRDGVRGLWDRDRGGGVQQQLGRRERQREWLGVGQRIRDGGRVWVGIWIWVWVWVGVRVGIGIGIGIGSNGGRVRIGLG